MRWEVSKPERIKPKVSDSKDPTRQRICIFVIWVNWTFHGLFLLTAHSSVARFQPSCRSSGSASDILFNCDFTNLRDKAASLISLSLFIVMIVCIYVFKPLILIKMCCNIIMLWSTVVMRAECGQANASGGNILCVNQGFDGLLKGLNMKSVCQS